MAEKSVFETLGRLLPRQRLLSVSKMLDRSGIDFSSEAFIGLLGILAIFFAFLFAFLSVRLGLPAKYIHDLVFLLIQNSIIYYIVLLVLCFLVATVTVLVVSYVLIGNMAEERRKKVEKVLPDFLLLAASNVRAGMGIDQALWYAARPEFGLLSKEVEIIAKNSFSGEPFDVSIDRLSKRFNSKQILRAVNLIKQSMITGGEIANVLEETAKDSRAIQTAEQNISASLVSYIIFISFLAAVGTPLLFSVAYSMVKFLSKAFANINVDQPVNVGLVMFQPRKPVITADDFLLFSVATIILTAITSAMLIGVIRAGKRNSHIKYVPVFIIIAFLVYYLLSLALEGIVSSFRT